MVVFINHDHSEMQTVIDEKGTLHECLHCKKTVAKKRNRKEFRVIYLENLPFFTIIDRYNQ